MENLQSKLIVGAKIRIGEKYSKEGLFSLDADEIITLVKGFFENDNGLYISGESAPAILEEDGKEYTSIYHLFGNNLEYFMDCEVLSSDGLVELTCEHCKEKFLGPEPRICCNGDMCGCGGMPVEPIICSEDCYNCLTEKYE